MAAGSEKCYGPAAMAKLRLTLLGGFEARSDSGLAWLLIGRLREEEATIDQGGAISLSPSGVVR